MNKIHVTDAQTFCTCRRRWDWSSMLRRGLQPALPPEPLFLGQGVHVALDKYYQLHYTERSMYHIENYFKEWLRSRKNAIIAYKGSLWEQEVDLLSSTERLGSGVLKHYHLWANKRDEHYAVVDTEVRFELPLPTDPPTVLAGRFDGIFRNTRDGKLYIVEFKTARSLTNIAWTLRNLQAAIYTIAAQQVYDDDVAGIVYRILRKKVPSDPKPLKRGGFSQAVSQDTSYEWFIHRLRHEVREVSQLDGDVCVLSQLHDNFDSLKDANRKILDHLLANDHKFFLERIIKKKKSQLENARTAIITLAHEMTSNPVIFAMPGIYCSWCSFKEPCDLVEYGMERDAKAVLAVEYARRDYWEEKDVHN